MHGLGHEGERYKNKWSRQQLICTMFWNAIHFL